MDVFATLPGEVLIHILKFVLVPDQPQAETLASYAARATPYRLLCARFNAAVDCVAGIHAHTFPGPQLTPIQIGTVSAHPTPHASVNAHRKYWSNFLPQPRDRQRHTFAQTLMQNLIVPRLPALRSISIDLVIPTLKRRRPSLSDSDTSTEEGAVLPFLHRLSANSHSMEFLHVRIPASQRCIDAIETVIAKNTQLASICVEVDSTGTAAATRPTLRLNNITLGHTAYAAVRRFVIRAPTCDVHFIVSPHRQRPFFDRLAQATEVGLVCYAFATTLPNWYWLYTLLRMTPDLAMCDIGIASPDDHFVPHSDLPVRPFRLPNLVHLSIHIPEIDTHMLRSMDAPFLYLLRLRSAVHIELWPDCDEGHFPSLFIVNVTCPGPSALRMEVLGIEEQDFSHNYDTGHEYFDPLREDFVVYIKPYERARLKVLTYPYLAKPFCLA
ncbi:hypothetical protein OC842_006488 [Tilletia horrida]|uniref:F-box domain-containing protein n=1 Tax=Tilletia horrida TaxID=155126 RepID=A0AAN6G845_9BASI|nr:hypothetical protein OC842_006488 [Tilletia horrida]